MKKTENRNFAFPDPMASDQEKAKASYGLKVAQAIGGIWFNGGMIQKDCTYMTRSTWIHKMRKFARGEQDTAFYKDLISRQEEDLSYLNLDWRPENTVGKFVNLVVNGMNEKYYRFNVTAIDRISTQEKTNYQKMLEKEMYSRKLVENAQKVLGLDVGTKGFVPKSMEEMDIHINTMYKPKQEVAEELLVQYVFDSNEWYNIIEQANKDLVQCGIAVVECRTDTTNGVVLDIVDIERYVHSYTNKNDFSDKTYDGVVRSVNILDLQRTGSFTEKQLKDIIGKYAAKNNSTFSNIKDININDCLHHEVNILDFSYKTSKKSVYKKRTYDNGNFKLIGKTSDFEHNDTPHYSKKEKTLDTWYEGSYVIGTEIVYGWKECENVVEDTLNRAQGRFITRATDIYNNELHSFLQDIIPQAEQIQITKLKLQHIIAEIKPGGAEIDLDMVANLSGGDQVDYKKIISIFNAKGIVFKKRIVDEHGFVKEGRAVEELHNGIPANLLQLLQILQYQQQNLRDITGINPSRDGTQPHNALVGIQQAQLVASNTITQHIVDASKYLKLKTAEVISTRIADIFRFKEEAKHLREIYEKAIGKLNVGILEEIGPIHLHEFGFTMEMLPTQEEMAYFEESMKLALQAGKIDEDDILDARAIAKKNPKYASQFLKVRKRERAEEEMKKREIEARIKSDNDIRSNTAASQNRAQEVQVEAQVEVEKAKALAMIEVQKQQMLNQVNAPVKQQEYKVDLYKKQMEIAGTMNLNKFKEDKKDERQNKNNTDHSKMIEQRNEKTPPIDFTKKESFADLFR